MIISSNFNTNYENWKKHCTKTRSEKEAEVNLKWSITDITLSGVVLV